MIIDNDMSCLCYFCIIHFLFNSIRVIHKIYGSCLNFSLVILTYQIISSNFRFPSFQLQPIVNNQRQPLILKDLYDHYEYVSLNNVYCLIFNSMTQIGCVCVSFFWILKIIFLHFITDISSDLLKSSKCIVHGD